MKNVFILLFSMLVLVSCKTSRSIPIPTDEKYVAEKITPEQAAELEKNYQADPDFKKTFRNGMYLPISVLDDLRKSVGIEGISIYYGKDPGFASPVFILYATKITPTSQQEKSADGGDVIYKVYYPCPTICGK